MSSQEEQLAMLRSFNEGVRAEDGEIAEEMTERESAEVRRPPHIAIEIESIAMRRQRPVLAIQDGTTTLEFKEAEDSQIWKARLTNASDVLRPAIAAVGRIDVKRHPDFEWVGTGWLVHDHILVTNRHVAELFAMRNGEKFIFQAGVDGEIGVALDFLQEIDRDGKRLFDVKGVRYIEERPGLDLAFLEVEPTGGKLAEPIALSSRVPQATPFVATIGYPAYDSRIPEPDLMEKIYGRVYDKKRLAPGAVTSVDDRLIRHNCTTLGGNSGSVVLDLATGEALGLHFSGSFMRTNYAVRADLVKQRLDALLQGKLAVRGERPRPSTGPRPGVSVARSSARQAAWSQGNGRVASLTIPLVISVSLGDAAQERAATPPRRPKIVGLPSREDDDTIAAEAKVEDYANRDGYKSRFLGKGFEVKLPEVQRDAGDVLRFGSGEHVLQYEHFSVVMNERRRMCFFSACNINGERSKSSKRAQWRFDPRIPRELQIMKECYGNAPKFSRGHMTRREDPAWGVPAAVQRGSDDSMHVTNATPQMQAFNSPIWLGLEDYALQHARQDDMNISVFTGPYLEEDDPEMFGVQIPVMFWKVIAFVHDDTGRLCATGYEMSQADNLEQPEFVFGNFRSPQLNVLTQIPIALIEKRAGISFGGLADVDPLAQEGIGDPRGPLHGFEQIRFL